MRNQCTSLLFTVTCLSNVLIGAVRSEVIIQRIGGFTPDRFIENEYCTANTCSVTYGGEQMHGKSCQCTCPEERPTFSIQHMTCVNSLQGCEDFTMTDKTRDTSNVSTLTLSVNDNLLIAPKLPVKKKATAQLLTEVLNCLTPKIIRIEHESVAGFKQVEWPTLSVKTNVVNNLTYLQFAEGQPSDNFTRRDIAGLLLKVWIRCADPPSIEMNSVCLPLKIDGFQRAGRRNVTTAKSVVPEQTTVGEVQKLPIDLAYIIGGIVLGSIVLTVLIIAIVMGCGCISKTETTPEIKVQRVKRQWSTNSSRRHPIGRIVRGPAVNDLSGQQSRRTASREESRKPQPKKPKASLRSIPSTSIDSGRGGSGSPGASATGLQDSKPVSDAILQFESELARTSTDVHQQPKLFKSHQEKLSTASQGISSVPAQTHKQGALANKKSSPMKRFFSRLHKSSSEATGSRLSIDYDQFCISEAPPSVRKRFSESHVNPSISFSTEGKLARAEEVHIDVPVARSDDGSYVEDDSYESESYNSSQLRHMKSSYDLDKGEQLPMTSIDDVGESASEFEAVNSVNDFVAI